MNNFFLTERRRGGRGEEGREEGRNGKSKEGGKVEGRKRGKKGFKLQNEVTSSSLGYF